jgi:hypothetical protein
MNLRVVLLLVIVLVRYFFDYDVEHENDDKVRGMVGGSRRSS